MTPQEIFELAAGWMGQTAEESDSLASFVPGLLNVLLAEALPYENALRRYEDLPELASAPTLTAAEMNTPLGWHEVILRTALPCGLAADFYRDDESFTLMDDFRTRFVTALRESIRCLPETVREVY